MPKQQLAVAQMDLQEIIAATAALFQQGAEQMLTLILRLTLTGQCRWAPVGVF